VLAGLAVVERDPDACLTRAPTKERRAAETVFMATESVKRFLDHLKALERTEKYRRSPARQEARRARLRHEARRAVYRAIEIQAVRDLICVLAKTGLHSTDRCAGPGWTASGDPRLDHSNAKIHCACRRRHA
jgi:hypothetical protein